MTSILGPRNDHGTRACYVAGCRCSACRGANARRYRERRAAVLAAAADVKPTGPAGRGVLLRGGKSYRVRTCPGANGSFCVAGGAWLRGKHQVCATCLERETVWDGLVPSDRVRAHLLELRRAGVGYKTVAAASDVAHTVLGDILGGRKQFIRASTERSVLAVDAGARADHAVVDAAAMNAALRDLRGRGFTLRHIAELLGYANRRALQLGGRPRAIALSAARVERLTRRVERGEVVPQRFLVDAREERLFLESLMAAGVSAKWLSRRLGFTVYSTRLERKMHPKNVAAVRRFRADIEELRREGVGRPDDWRAPDSSLLRLAQGFGFEGGWLVRGGTSGKSAARLKTRVAAELREFRARRAP